MSSKRGFTLIELLVVIAIIGMLAAVILAALSGTRVKGQDAALKTDMHNISIQGEIVYNANTPSSYNNLCTDATIVKMFTGITTLEGIQTNVLGLGTQADFQHVTCHMYPNGGTKTDYAIEAPLPSAPTTQFWCIDSTGKAESTPTALGASLVLISAAQCP